MKVRSKSAFSFAAFASPICIVGLAFAARVIKEEDLGFQVLEVGGAFFAIVAFVGLLGAFVRKERLRWFTLLPLLVIYTLFFQGVQMNSVSSEIQKKPNQTPEPTAPSGRGSS